jgi:nucleoside-diphosphate kinase
VGVLADLNLLFEEPYFRMERTYIMVKPDGVRRGLTGEIIRRFEDRGLRLAGLKMLVPTRETAEKHYAVHRERPFYGELVAFITSGPVVAMVWEGANVVRAARQMIGATNPLDAAPGSLRGDFALETGQNLIHGSDAPETAQAEIALWFDDGDVLSS